MHTIGDLRKALGLATDNQVRNRIQAIKDLLYPHLRRGPNNQILVSDAGVSLLRELQELYDSGLTIVQASSILTSKSEKYVTSAHEVSSGLTTNMAKQREADEVIGLLREEIAFLRQRVKYLEQQQSDVRARKEHQLWWEKLREETNGA